MSDKKLNSIKEVLEKYESRLPKKIKVEIRPDENVLPSGFKFLDKQTGGFHKGEIVLFYSTEYDRKDLLFSLVDNICVERNKTSLLFSEESTGRSLERLVRIKIGSEPELFCHMVNIELSPAYQSAIKKAKDAPLYLTDNAKPQPSDIEEFCDSFCNGQDDKKNIDLIVVDNIPMIPFSTRSEHITLQLKKMAKKYGCVVFFMVLEELLNDEAVLNKADLAIAVSTNGSFLRGNAKMDILKSQKVAPISFEISHNRSFGKFSEIDTIVF